MIESEEQAIFEAKKGRYDGQRYLYDLYKSSWYVICLRYLSNKNDANDALQNGMINIFSKIDSFNQNLGTFKSWSSRIIVNDCIMLIRKMKKTSNYNDINDQDFLFDETTSPLDNISAQEILKMVQMLPEGYRTVFNMYAIEGYSHKEIAETLDVTEGTTKSQLFKARKMLREMLESVMI